MKELNADIEIHSPFTGISLKVHESESGRYYLHSDLTGDIIPLRYIAETSELACNCEHFLKWVDICTLKDASEITGYSKQRVSQMLRSGLVKGIKILNACIINRKGLPMKGDREDEDQRQASNLDERSASDIGEPARFQ